MSLSRSRERWLSRRCCELQRQSQQLVVRSLPFNFTMPFSYTDSRVNRESSSMPTRERKTTAEMLYTQTHDEKKSTSKKKRWKRESRVRENCNVWPTKDIQIGSWTWSDILQWWKMYMNVWMIFSLSLCFTAALALARKRSRDDDCCLSLLIFFLRESLIASSLSAITILAIFNLDTFNRLHELELRYEFGVLSLNSMCDWIESAVY